MSDLRCEYCRRNQPVKAVKNDFCEHTGLTYEELVSQLSTYKEALEQVDKYWYDPSVATGACIFCDANLFPPDMGKHNDWCVVLVAHKALTPVQSPDAREKETK